MNNLISQNQFEIQSNEYLKKITDLEFENSVLSQKNKLLEKKLESLTTKYNDLKKELFDIEEHINYCKDNQIQLVEYNKNDNKKQASTEINKDNFNVFKNKIKTLFEYDDNFLNTDSDIVVYNMIIDNIMELKTQNLSLRRAVEGFKNIIEKNNNNKNYNNFNYKNININNINNNNNTDDDNNLNDGNITPISPIEYNKNFNYNINNMNNNYNSNNNSFDIDDKEKLMNNNFDNIANNDNIKGGYTYNIVDAVSETNDMDKYYINDDINKRCLNSKRDFNDLMNNINNLHKVFKTESYNFEKPKITTNNYSYLLNRPRKYHKYI
jgi:hypothetical protein